MRVAAIHLVGHPVLGDLDVDLRGLDGKASRLVVLAGENGCGKTLILEAIFSALQPPQPLARFAKKDAATNSTPKGIRVIVEADEVSALPEATGLQMPAFLRDQQIDIDSREFSVWRDEVDPGVYGPVQYERRLRSGEWTGAVTQPQDGLLTSCFYSEANVSFAVPEVTSSNSADANGLAAGSPGHTSSLRRGGASLGSEITQMLVNLATADADDLHDWTLQHPGEPAPAGLADKRWSVFAEAFGRMFDGKRLARRARIGNGYRVLFHESGRTTSLATLSTGEKQIVFRGAFLLRQMQELPGSVVLIDEPELSLHPRWQERILEFYDGIVKEEPGKCSQIVLATHSPFIVHGSPTAKHIVLRRDPATGKIGIDPEPSYPGVTPADVAVAAFSLSEFVRDAQRKQLLLLVEGKTDKIILEEAWTKLHGPKPMWYTIRSADGAKNIPRLLGAGSGKSGPLLDALAGTGTTLVGLFDFDREGHDQWNGAIVESDGESTPQIATTCQLRKRCGAPIWSALLPVPSFRQGYASSLLGGNSRLTIELLFPDCYVGHLLTRVQVASDGNATRLEAEERQKGVLAAATAGFPAAAFAMFEPIFDLLKQIATVSP